MRSFQDIRYGVANSIETYLTTHLSGLWKLIQRVPALHRRVNGILIDRAIMKIPTRPNPLSTMGSYTSWASLSDRAYDSRHLPPAEEGRPSHPAAEDVAALFTREGEMTRCEKSTVLFPYFAAWFVDGFLRSERPKPDPDTGEPRRDVARNESNHEIDLIQIYGLNDQVTRQLRAEEGGLLQHQLIDGEEYPPYLYEGEKKNFDKVTLVRDDEITADQRRQLFAVGSDTGNLQVGFVMMNVLFLREHNRIARMLEKEYGWDDERLFQTTRNILTVILIKIVVEDYINHISPFHLKLLADPTGFGNPRWYRQNWMSIEFNLLYRWHSLVPSSFRIGDREIPINDTLFNTDVVIERGLGACFESASNQRAGRVGLFNSPREVWHAELASVEQARAVKLRPYNDYRELARFPRARRFEDVSSDAAGPAAPARRLRRRRRHRVLSGPVRRGRTAQRRASATHRPDGGDRRVLAGVHESPARPADLQPRDLLAARLERDRLDSEPVRLGAPQRPESRAASEGHHDALGLGPQLTNRVGLPPRP